MFISFSSKLFKYISIAGQTYFGQTIFNHFENAILNATFCRKMELEAYGRYNIESLMVAPKKAP